MSLPGARVVQASKVGKADVFNQGLASSSIQHGPSGRGTALVGSGGRQFCAKRDSAKPLCQ